MTSIGGYSSISVALGGLKQADQALVAAVEAVNSGSLDLNSMAQAAALLQSADIQGRASLAVLQTSLDQQRTAIDILA